MHSIETHLNCETFIDNFNVVSQFFVQFCHFLNDVYMLFLHINHSVGLFDGFIQKYNATNILNHIIIMIEPELEWFQFDPSSLNTNLM